MNCTIDRHMIVAEVLKLRRHRPTMAAALLLSIGITVLYFAVIELRHGGGLGGAQVLSDGSSLLSIYFGSFTAILIGTEVGTIDLANGVFRDLVATGRSRIALFFVRIPAAIVVALAFNLSGFVLTVVAAIAFRGSAPPAGLGLILQSGGWVVLATAVITSLAVGVASFTGSRSLTLTAVIAWQTIVSTLLFTIGFLGSTRDAVLQFALGHFRPGIAYGTHAHPGSSNALPGYELPMSTGVALLVILAWTVLPAVAGAWRSATRDA
jgi:hypothetical protein